MDEADLHKPLTDQTAEQALVPLRNCCYAFIVLNTLFVAGRLISRFLVRRLPFWWDDFWVLPAYACNIGACAIGLYMVHIEKTLNNTDVYIIDPVELPIVLKSIFAIEQLILPGYALTRFSILALYLRIFSDRGVRIGTWVVTILIALQWFSFSLASLFQCTPVQFFWNRTLPGGHCVDINPFYRSFTIPNIIFDIVIVLLPIPTVWSLKASRVRKWGLTFVFGIGTIALVASCIRLYVYETHTSELIAPSLTNVLISWLIVEPGIYLIAACLPAMHHLFAAMIPQPLQDVLENKLAAFRHPLSPGGRGQSPNDASAGAHPLYGEFTKLTDSNNQATSAKSARGRKKNSQNKTEDYELEQGRTPFPSGAIMVTTEVIITQEERIADVMGF